MKEQAREKTIRIVVNGYMHVAVFKDTHFNAGADYRTKRRRNLTIEDTQVTPDKKVLYWWIFVYTCFFFFIQIFDTFICLFKRLCITYVNSVGNLRWEMATS